MFNRIMCGLLDKLREFAVPYLQYQLPVLSEVLKTLVKEIKTVHPVSKAARKRSKFEQAYGSYVLEAHSTDPKESGVIVSLDAQRGHTFLKLLQMACRNF